MFHISRVWCYLGILVSGLTVYTNRKHTKRLHTQQPNKHQPIAHQPMPCAPTNSKGRHTNGLHTNRRHTNRLHANRQLIQRQHTNRLHNKHPKRVFAESCGPQHMSALENTALFKSYQGRVTPNNKGGGDHFRNTLYIFSINSYIFLSSLDISSYFLNRHLLFIE